MRHFRDYLDTQGFLNPVFYNRLVERQAQVCVHLQNSFRLAPSASARVYPSSTPRLLFPATSSAKSSTRRWRDGLPRTNVRWAGSMDPNYIWSSTTWGISSSGNSHLGMLTTGNQLKNKAFTEESSGNSLPIGGFSTMIFWHALCQRHPSGGKAEKEHEELADESLWQNTLQKKAGHRDCQWRTEKHLSIESIRHRSIDNFTSNHLVGLVAYNLLPKKPLMNIEIIDRSKLIA